MATRHRESRIGWWFSMLVLGVVFLVISVASGGYFFLPILFGLIAWGLLYLVVKYVQTRNDLSVPPDTPSERWADGQPYGRSIEEELELRRRHEAEQIKDADTRPRPPHRDEFHPGPPPIVPFP